MSLFECVFRNSADPLILHDGERLLDCNGAARSLFGGGDRDDLLAAKLEEIYAEGQLGSGEEPSSRAGDAAAVRRFRQRDGGTFLAEATTSIVSDGVRDVFCLSLRRTSAAEALQRALEARESNLRLVLDSLPGRMAWIGADRRFRYVNRSFESFPGFTREEILGRTVPQVIGEEAYRHVEPFGAAALNGEVQHWEGWLPYSAAGRRYVKRTYAPSYRDDGAIDGYFIFSLDLTEQKQAEQEIETQREALYQSEKLNALGSLLAGVAHELNNPLAVVLTQASLLRDEARDSAIERRGERIYAAAERCARIVRSFLAIARQKPSTREPLDLEALIRSALELTGYGLKASGVDVSIDSSVRSTKVLGDADHLTQVFMNLLVNAQHALEETAGERRVRISANEEAQHVAVRLADNGPGIAPEVASRIFEPFFTTKPQELGTGIGLSVCRGIVDAHGGTLQAEATPGGGATFVVRLPKATGLSEIGTSGGAVSGGQGSARAILVVDDEPDMADVIAEIVAPLADRVDVVESGRAAIDRLARDRYDLVISDVRMPGLDGPALYDHLAQTGIGARCPILFVTGDTLHHRLDELLALAGTGVVEKPFEPQHLREQVLALLTRTV